MSNLWKVLVVLGVVFAVGCGAATTHDERLDAAVQAAGRKLTADERYFAAMRAAGRELTADERLDAAFAAVQAAGATLEAIPPPSLQEGDAIKLVQFELRKSLNNCASLGPYRCNTDHVLKALGAGRTMPSFRVNVISAIGKTLLEQGEWTAVYESDSRRWRVMAFNTLGSSIFYVYETTLIIEGLAPSSN